LTKTLYEILGVEESSSGDEIRSAYRKLAKQLHPDLNPGDKAAEEQFKEVSSAFSIQKMMKNELAMIEVKSMKAELKNRLLNIIGSMRIPIPNTIITVRQVSTISQTWEIFLQTLLRVSKKDNPIQEGTLIHSGEEILVII